MPRSVYQCLTVRACVNAAIGGGRDVGGAFPIFFQEGNSSADYFTESALKEGLQFVLCRSVDICL